MTREQVIARLESNGRINKKEENFLESSGVGFTFMDNGAFAISPMYAGCFVYDLENITYIEFEKRNTFIVIGVKGEDAKIFYLCENVPTDSRIDDVKRKYWSWFK